MGGEINEMKVLLAEGRPDVRSALRLLLEQESDLTIESEVTRIEDLLAQLERMCVDLVLLDWELPGLKPKKVLSLVRGCCPGLKIVAISGRPESRSKALKAGADIFVSKTDAPEYLLDAIDVFRIGNTQISETSHGCKTYEQKVV
jgi:DNA-binding NarL/FixJ family response regulator